MKMPRVTPLGVGKQRGTPESMIIGQWRQILQTNVDRQTSVDLAAF